jgi:hypothetical protein
MKNKFLIVLSLFAFLLALSLVSATQGSIKTTRANCVDPVNENHYVAGESVYIHGTNFASDTYSWDITGQPGQASCDPDQVVANGSFTVNSSGSFCFLAYNVSADDCGEYKATFDNKHDNYHVDQGPVVPEFGLIAGVTTVLAAIGIFFYVRRK